MRTRFLALALGVFLHALPGRAADMREPLPQVFSEAEFATMLASVDRALAWIASQQDADGSFRAAQKSECQPALTALPVMAFLSRGHRPGVGPYGALLDRAIDFTLLSQKWNGVFAWRSADGQPRTGLAAGWDPRQQDTYSHAIALLMLGEVYGMTGGERSGRVRIAIEKGLRFTHESWNVGKKAPKDDGGWRYFTYPFESDLSVTGWHALSLRSVKNAGFDVPKEVTDRVATYVRRCYQPEARRFIYIPGEGGGSPSLAMTGAGVLCLSLFGEHQHPFVIAGGATLAQVNFSGGNDLGDRPFYTCYYLTQAAAQLGGEPWRKIYRKTSDYLLPLQQLDGSWAPIDDRQFGPIYSTTLVVLALTPQLQLLPIYQH